MTTGDILLRNVLADPADDTARLVYADWLQENGADERAEFIRVQVELEPLRGLTMIGDDLKRAKALYDREVNLDPLFRRGFLRRYGAVVGLSRGFAESVTCTVGDFLRHADAMFAAHPITRVMLTDRAPDIADLGEYEPRVWVLPDPGVILTDARCLLPHELFDRLPDPDQPAEYPDEWIGHDRAHAYHALSVACVRYGRNLAGLPDLTRAQVGTSPVPTQQGEG